MKIKTLLPALLALVALSMSAQKLFTLEDLNFGGRNYHNLRPQNIFLTWWGDQLMYQDVEEGGTIDANGQKHVLFTLLETDIDFHSALGATYPYPDQPLVLLRSKNRRALYNFKEERFEWAQTANPDETEQHWSKESRTLAFKRNQQLYVRTANGEEHQLTTDGSREIVYGESVHRDEFGISEGLFWSPDGQRLAFYKKDQSRIPSYPQVDITQRIAKTYVDKYPMAGEESEDVSVAVYDVPSGKTVWLQNDKPLTDYMTNLSWAPDAAKLYVFELNRDQNHMQLFGYDAATGAKDATPLLEEKHPKYVEPLHTLVFLPWDATKAIMQSRRDNWNHLYLIDLKKSIYPEWREAGGGGTTCDHVDTRLLTPGDFEVRDFLGFNATTKKALFIGNVTHPLHQTVWSVPVSGKGKTTPFGNIKNSINRRVSFYRVNK